MDKVEKVLREFTKVLESVDGGCAHCVEGAVWHANKIAEKYGYRYTFRDTGYDPEPRNSMLVSLERIEPD